MRSSPPARFRVTSPRRQACDKQSWGSVSLWLLWRASRQASSCGVRRRWMSTGVLEEHHLHRPRGWELVQAGSAELRARSVGACRRGGAGQRHSDLFLFPGHFDHGKWRDSDIDSAARCCSGQSVQLHHDDAYTVRLRCPYVLRRAGIRCTCGIGMPYRGGNRAHGQM
jgi:hypothetical protein